MSRIVVVDASPSVRETLRIVLGDEHDVLVAASLADLEHVAAHQPALLILGLGPGPRAERPDERTLPEAPMLLLHDPADAELRGWHGGGRPCEFLPKPFNLDALRRRVTTMLRAPASATRTARDDSVLRHPFLTREAAAVVDRARTTDLPVLLHGEAGSGAERVARALHAVAGSGGPFVALSARSLGPGELTRRAPAGGTLFVEHVDRLAPAAQDELARLVRPAGGIAPRLISTSGCDLARLAARGEFHLDLAYALTTLTVPLPPLRERAADLPALVASLSEDIARRLGLGHVRYSDTALARLRHYLWFGNVAELEAVLARTLSVHRPRLVDADHVLFVPAGAPAMVEDPGPAPPDARERVAARPTPAPTPGAARLEILLGELAHELRNPMVTIKTFTQHLEQVLRDPEARARFAALTTEAVDRMDALLELLLEFARFRAPVVRAADGEAVVARVLADAGEILGRKRLRIERNGARTGEVLIDEAQASFALRAVLQGLAEVARNDGAISVRTLADTGLEFRAPTEPAAVARLAALVEGGTETGAAGPDPPPLRLALAAALLERNGGGLTIRRDADDTTAVVVRLGQPSGATPR